MSERRDKPRRVYVQEPSRVGEVGLATRLRWVGVIVAVVVIALTMSRYAAVSGSDALTEQDDPEEVGVGPESGQVGRASFGSENSDPQCGGTCRLYGRARHAGTHADGPR